MRRLLLTGVALAALLLGGAAPVFAGHQGIGCDMAQAATAGTAGAGYVADACARTHPAPQNP